MEPTSISRLETSLPGITAVPIIGIVRNFPRDTIVDIVAAATESGLRVVEITLDSEDPFDQISRLVDALPGLTVGAGTVLNVDEAIRAAEVGAQFIVSPIIRETTMEAALDRGLAVVPGAASPTEIDRAWNAGATAVKVFPIHQLGGVPYLNAILSPLRKPALVPTGGVTAESTPDYLAAGAVAVGAGADLFSVSDFANGGSAAIAANAKAWVEAAT